MNLKTHAIIIILICCGGALCAEPITSEQLQFFESKVRPLLADNCYKCHSNKAEKLKGGLYLDHGITIISGGDSGPSVVAGDPDKSLLIEAVRYTNPDTQMPPKKKLSDEHIKILEDWVLMGAPWPNEPLPDPEKKLGPKVFDLNKRKSEHWCWQPIAKNDPPQVAYKDWSSDPIDLYVLSALEKKGLKPSLATDKNSLIRRVYFDLVGLPPRSDEVHEFLNDNSDDAYEKLVDRLLSSSHFGERWARHWMDLVRYAESCGHEFDYPIPYATEYRDYLIRAFNNDVRYDQFAVEHIAGDLLEAPRKNQKDNYNESVIGTGFWHLHEATHAPTDVRGNEVERVDNQIDVFSKAFLGLTVSCARCHDHMFDAISTKDYYALAGYLQSSRRQEAFLDPGDSIESKISQIKKLKSQLDGISLDSFTKNVSPDKIALYLMASKEAISGVPLSEVLKRYKISEFTLNRWIEAVKDPKIKDPEHPLFVWSQFIDANQNLTPVLFDKKMETVKRRLADQQKQHIESTKDSIKFADFSESSYKESGWLVHGEAFEDAPTKPGEWVQSDGKAAVPGRANGGRLGGKLQGVLRSPTFTISHNQIHHRLGARKGGLRIRVIIDGYYMEPYNGLLFGGTRLNDPNTDGHNNWMTQGRDLKMYKGHKAHIEYIDHGDGYFDVDEIWFSDGGAPKSGASAIAYKIASNDKIHSVQDLAIAYGWLWKRSINEGSSKIDEDGKKFLAWGVSCGVDNENNGDETLRLRKEVSKLCGEVPAPRKVQALCDGTEENEFVLLRGNHKRLGDEVPRRFLTALGGEKEKVPLVGSGRLSLAMQVTDINNPLTARVFVNRLWHHLFGRGIVPSTDDFGVLGKRPSNPDLLDHLASSFMGDDWSIKRAIRRMVLTQTYHQSSTTNPEGSKADPENILLHRANLKRIQGESIRDSILMVSGRIDDKIFCDGGSVPVHLTDFMTGRGRPRGGPLDGKGKRSLYVSVKRNFLSPMMLAFDTPVPFSSMGKRTVSNVPAQALIMMNDPFVHEQSVIWAKSLTDAKLNAAQIVDRMYMKAFARVPSEKELGAALEFLGEEKVDVQKLTDFSHVIFNTKEFIFLR